MATEPNETDGHPEEPEKSPENSTEDSEERTGLEQELEELLAQQDICLGIHLKLEFLTILDILLTSLHVFFQLTIILSHSGIFQISMEI